MLKGYLVLTATSANAGLSMLKEQTPDVVVLDVRLGRESGMDLLRDFITHLEQNRVASRTRFIVITAYPDDDVKREALEKYKVDAFMMKPFDPNEIKYAVMDSIVRILQSEIDNLSAWTGKPQSDHTKKELADKKIQAHLRPLA